MGDYFVSGKSDIFDGTTIGDYKVTSSWVVVHKRYDEWEKQLNVYRYLWQKHGFDVKQLQVIAILRDWSRMMYLRSPKDYPSGQVAVVYLPMWSMEQTETFIHQRLSLHKLAESMADDEIPVCSPEERWDEPPTWRVLKEGNKNALRVLHSEEDANKYIEDKYKGNDKITIVKKNGLSRRCCLFCNVSAWCNFYKSLPQEMKDENA